MDELIGRYGGVKQDVWDRQVNHFWDMAWAISEDDAMLDIRKNLRTHLTQPEEGEKCTICGERQEVSGKGMDASVRRQEMRDWWAALRQQLDTHRVEKATIFDLKDDERLCAVCIVKRAYPFPEIAKKAIGWEVPVNYPSTSYMAAVDWITRVFKRCADPQYGATVQRAARGLIGAAEAAGVWLSETATHINSISQAGENSGLTGIIADGKGRKEWQFIADLDGDAFFKSAIRNPREFEVAGDDPKDFEKSRANSNREKLLTALETLQKTLPEKSGQPREATPFYALLLMDGDGMGKLLRKYSACQEDITAALAQFTRAVPDIVKPESGSID